MQKPAREQGRNNQVGRYALPNGRASAGKASGKVGRYALANARASANAQASANAGASAIIFQLPSRNVKINDLYRNVYCGLCV